MERCLVEKEKKEKDKTAGYRGIYGAESHAKLLVDDEISHHSRFGARLQPPIQ